MALQDGIITEPEVIKAVTEEIKKLGENTKANYEEMNRRHNELKSLLDSTVGKYDTVIENEAKKLATDISTRQAAIDKQIEANDKKQAELFKVINDRMDEVEVAFQRSAKGESLSTEEKKEATEFYKSVLAVSSNGQGVTADKMKKVEVKYEEYKEYKESFADFLRTRDEVRRVSPERFKSLSVGIDPDGGYTVTPYMSNRIIEISFESDPIYEMAEQESITTGAMEWLVDWDEAGFGWEEETVAGAETDTPQFFKKRIPVYTAYAKPRASQTLLEDSGINIENWLARKVGDRFRRGIGAAFVTGNGVGRPRGFLTYGNGTTYGTVEQVNLGNASTLNADGLITLKFTLKEDVLNSATWLMSRSTVAASLLLKDGSGNYIWSPNYQDAKYSMLLGSPVRMSTTMPAVAANALSVAIGDWRRAYTVVNRLGITIQRDPFTVKPMVEFYTRMRIGGDINDFDALKIGVIHV